MLPQASSHHHADQVRYLEELRHAADDHLVCIGLIASGILQEQVCIHQFDRPLRHQDAARKCLRLHFHDPFQMPVISRFTDILHQGPMCPVGKPMIYFMGNGKVHAAIAPPPEHVAVDYCGSPEDYNRLYCSCFRVAQVHLPRLKNSLPESREIV